MFDEFCRPNITELELLQGDEFLGDVVRLRVDEGRVQGVVSNVDVVSFSSLLSLLLRRRLTARNMGIFIVKMPDMKV